MGDRLARQGICSTGPLPEPETVPGGYRFYYAHRVGYSEVDAQSIVFNSHYLTFVDEAVVEYLRYLGWDSLEKMRVEHVETVLVKSTVEFLAPAMLDDVLHVWVRTAEMGRSSLTKQFEIRRQDGTLLTQVETVYVNYDLENRRSRPLPEEVKQRIRQFEATGEVRR